MNGKLLGSLIVGMALAAGAAVYYLQVYAYYETLAPEEVRIELTSKLTGRPEPVPAEDLRAIDSQSSPLRFRACFTLPLGRAALEAGFQAMPDAVPLNAPGWFDCFDAAELGAALEDGRASAYLGRAEIRPGADRVVAVFDDGRAYAWHQLNPALDD